MCHKRKFISYSIVCFSILFVLSSDFWYEWILSKDKSLVHLFIRLFVFFLTSGFGSHNNEQIDSKTLEIVNAGDQLLRRISRQIEPFALIFG